MVTAADGPEPDGPAGARLLAAIDEYYAVRGSGDPGIADRLLAKYADVDASLKEFLDGAECVDRLAAQGAGDAGPETIAGTQGEPATAGNYEIERELGQGGMGIVYQARHRTTNRRVALKMVRTERLASAESVQRFQVEIRAVAALDHPNIVPIYEVGELGGRPFFTMKLLDAGPLSDRLASYNGNPAGAARVVFTIAKALEEAHARGILHRDVKPQNILLDATGRAHLTDFGLAKLCDGNLDLTRSTAALGSPHYMAPEQARGRLRDVTTAADIYGLGATLYALLAGRPPFEADSLFELLHLIQNTDPIPLRRLNPGVPADLEVICLKCLRKERSERYATAGELADDLHAFLHGLPIRARPPSSLGRVWLWCRRNRTVAALSGILACALVVGVAVSTTFWRMAESRLVQITGERNRAESSYRLSRAALDQSVRLMLENPKLRKGPLEKLRLDVLTAQLDFHERFVREHGSEPMFSADLAQSHFTMGRVANEMHEQERALAHFRRALEVYEELSRTDGAGSPFETRVGACWQEIAGILDEQNRPPEIVEQAFERARTTLLQRIRRAPDDFKARLELAGTLKCLGSLRRKTGHHADAVALHRQSVDLARRLREQSPSDTSQALLAAAVNELGYSFEVLHEWSEAQAAYVEAEALYIDLMRSRPDDPDILTDLAYAHSNLASVLGRTDPGAAERQHARAIRVWEQLASDHPQVVKYRVRLAETYGYYGDCLRESRRHTDAENAYQTSLTMITAVSDPGADAAIARRIAGYAWHGLGQVRALLSRREDALCALREAREIYSSLAAEFPQMHEAVELRIGVSRTLDELHRAPEDYEELLAVRREIAADCRQLASLSPHSGDYRSDLADALGLLADALLSAGLADEAAAVCEEGIALNRLILSAGEVGLRPELRARTRLARLYGNTRQYARAERELRHCVELCRSRQESPPGRRRWAERLADALAALGEFLETGGFTDEAHRLFAEAIELRRNAAAARRTDAGSDGSSAPTTADHNAGTAAALGALRAGEDAPTEGGVAAADVLDQLQRGELALFQGRTEEALAFFSAGCAALEATLQIGTDDRGRSLSMLVHSRRASVLSSLGRSADAIADWDAALACDPNRSASLRIARACDLARIGLCAEAGSAIGELELLPALPANQLYQAAQTLALCAREGQGDGAACQAFIERSLGLLRRALAAGFRNLPALEGDAALDVLRGRGEFEHLAADLQSADAGSP